MRIEPRRATSSGGVLLLLLVASLSWALPASAALAEHSAAAAWLAGDQPARLDAALAELARVQAAGGWPPLQPLADGVILHPGMRHAAVRNLRERLRVSGDFTGTATADAVFFDAALRDALLRFQRRNGLRDNGMLNPRTLAALNVPVEARIAQLQLARSAWAALPAATPATVRRVWVNIPEATVTAIEGNRIALQLRAVVGHPTRPTPVLSSAISRVIVNPAWTVPPGIAADDLVPRQLADPDYLRQHGFRIYASWSPTAAELDPAAIDWQRLRGGHFPYRLRQNPGPDNSLGRYKFEFPNAADIYLHDTPAQALLGLSQRSLSSGCVRVAEPARLADWLVQQPDPQLHALAEGSDYSTYAVPLANRVRIDLVYLSAWVSADGTVNLRRDVYRQDRLTAAQ